MDYPDDSSSIAIESNNHLKNLPNELLAKIFSTVVYRWQDPSELPSPVLLSSICRHWRMLAQNTPELWVNIIVPLHKSPEDCIHWTADWIARSGILPISVMIDDTTRGNIMRHADKIMTLLSQHSERLRRLTLRSIFADFIKSAFYRLRSAPNLQQLSIYGESTSPSWVKYEGHGQRQYSLDFPRLTILKARGLMVPTIRKLTSLSISGSGHAISQIFTASPGLKHLTLHQLMPLGELLPHATLMRVDSLHSLAVNLRWGQPRGQGSTYIFKYLSMPNIEYLELDGDGWKACDFGQSLSSAKIDTLRISNRPENSLQVDTINFLHSFSTTRHLQLVNTSTRGLLSGSARGLAHKTSLNFRNPSRTPIAPTNLDTLGAIQHKQSTSASVWPDLRIITLDTLTAGDVLNLCNFVTSHKRVQVLELSKSVIRHLSSSLRRKDDSVFQRPSLFIAAGNEEGSNDVEEWLGKMADIRTLYSPSTGLLDDV
ncbi:hypothetical protein BYT27DRAFT_6610498 [Phlegmacium glaucopus]|nr:hypothetical protein BYT27DRAFT_6610498 [Phlegmacium glaucopus]